MATHFKQLNLGNGVYFNKHCLYNYLKMYAKNVYILEGHPVLVEDIGWFVVYNFPNS